MQSWSAVILCYNERNTIGNIATSAADFFKEISGDDFEIIIVDDGSEDDSLYIIKDICKQNSRIRYIEHNVNKGIGAGLKSGYDAATKENVIIFSGDGQFDFTEIRNFSSFNENDFLCFYRQENATYTGFRVFLSYMNKFINHNFLGIKLKDVNWAKAYKTKKIKTLDLKLKSSLIESEICSKLMILGNKPIEIESKYLPRLYGTSKGSSLKIIFQAIKDIILLIYVITRYRIKNGNK